MRTRVFRLLAGLLAALFVWFLATADHADWSFRKLVGFWAVAVLFGVFAVFGTESAERLLCLLTGQTYPNRLSDENDASDDKSV